MVVTCMHAWLSTKVPINSNVRTSQFDSLKMCVCERERDGCCLCTPSLKFMDKIQKYLCICLGVIS